jgi:hypothetical protein
MYISNQLYTVMFKIVRCVTIVTNIGKSAYKKLYAAKQRWVAGQRMHAVADGATTLVSVGCTAIVLYDPYILFRPLLMIVPYAVQWIPIIGTNPLLHTIIVYGMEFVAI